MILIQGKGVSTGVAIGPLYFYQRAKATIDRYEVADTDAEWQRFKDAQQKAIDQLGELAEKARAEAGDEAALLFETHQMMAEDLDFEETIQGLITENKLNAEAAVTDTAAQFAEMFAAMDDSYMQARAADVKDVSGRILAILTGAVQGGIDSPVPVILAADDLAPSETVQLDKSKILGFVTEGGSGSSHTAILARTMGIPAIIGVGDQLKKEYVGREVIVDGATGVVTVDADADIKVRMLKKQEEIKKRQELLNQLKGKENVTKDGQKVRVFCNIGNPEDVHTVLENDGGGIGLFRSEFLYLGCDDYPTEDYQFEAYKKVLSDMGGREVVIRTLDIGADKQIEYFNLQPGTAHLPQSARDLQDPASGPLSRLRLREAVHHVPHGHQRLGGPGSQEGLRTGEEGADEGRSALCRRRAGGHHDRDPRRGRHQRSAGPGGGLLLLRHQRPDPVHPGLRPAEQRPRPVLRSPSSRRAAAAQDGGGQRP